MALFGKKESEGRTPGVQSPKTNKDILKDQKKIRTKPAPTGKSKGSTNETTYLGKNLRINGNISGDGSLIILGKFEGEFDINGQVKVAQGAVIKGNIKANGVSINGVLNGTVEASEKILLDTTASIKGRLVTPKISIQDGAVFDGELQMSKKQDQLPKAASPEAKEHPKATAVSEIK